MEAVHIHANVGLEKYSAMRLGGKAKWLSAAADDGEVEELVEWAKAKSVPFMMIGTGSNIVWRDEGFQGLVIVNKIMGREILDEDEAGVTIRVGGGENWDEVVGRAVEHGWSGIEFLSKIPGTAGAAPVQNIGAYGSELAESLVEVEAFDTKNDSFIGISNKDCGFSYRNSRFKSQDKGRFMIIRITLRLKKENPKPPFYESLDAYFKQKNITSFTPATVRQAVAAIRAIKLPDPSVVANNGSFFINPFVSHEQFESLQKTYPDIKGWPLTDGRVKLAAGWLVEKAGFRGIRDEETGMATWPHQALVLVNEHADSTSKLLKFKAKIVDKVQEMFGVTLEQEPELLP